jgi:hypothetical protein
MLSISHLSKSSYYVTSGFTAVVPRPPPVASFSLCGLRLFVIKRISLSYVSLLPKLFRAELPNTDAHPAAAWAAPSDAVTDRYLTVEKLHQAARRAQCGGAADSLRARISEEPICEYPHKIRRPINSPSLFCPDSRRPRARVPLVVWTWDLFVMRLLCCGLPAPARRQFFALQVMTFCHEAYCPRYS